MSFDAVNFSPYSPPRDTLPSGSSSSAGGIASTFSSFSRGGYSPIGASSTSAAAGSSSNQPFVSPSNLEQAERVNKYETALPIRLDVEAVLCYALGCISGVILLILETKNDYVRFHAWQSSIVFSAVIILHFLLSFSSVLSWMLFVGDLGLIGWLGYQAYINSDSLERYELPYVGELASTWVDTE